MQLTVANASIGTKDTVMNEGLLVLKFVMWLGCNEDSTDEKIDADDEVIPEEKRQQVLGTTGVDYMISDKPW